MSLATAPRLAPTQTPLAFAFGLTVLAAAALSGAIEPRGLALAMGLVLGVTLFKLQRQSGGVPRLTLAGLILAGAGVVLWHSLSRGASETREVETAVAYLLGIGAAWLFARVDRIDHRLGRLGTQATALGLALRAAGLMVFLALWRGGEGVVFGRLPPPAELAEILLAALHVLTMAQFAAIAGERLPADRPTRRAALTVAALAGLGTAIFFDLRMRDAPDGLPPGLLSITGLMLVGLLVLQILTGRRIGAPIVACAMAGQLPVVAALVSEGRVPTPGPLVALGLGLLLLSLLILGLRLAYPEGAAARDLAPGTTAGFQAQAQAWLAELDLDRRRVRFPLQIDGNGPAPEMTFTEFFGAANFADVLELLRRLQQPGAAQAAAAQPRMTMDLPPPAGSPRPVVVSILAVQGQRGWLGLSSLDESLQWRQRAARLETQLAQALLREERLLSIASHELRTPVAILSMMTEELKSGASWNDVSISFEATLARLVAILDDLRVGNEGLQRNVFALREIGLHLMETFGGAATANGIALRLDLSQLSDLPLQGDQARVLIALTKLVHNAILHSRATTVTLTGFVTLRDEHAATVTWQVADDGIGIPPDRRDSLFEPFDGEASSTGNSAAGAGLGLYTARRAMRLMGGDLVLQPAAEDAPARPGSIFVLTHPVRLADMPPAPEADPAPAPESDLAYPGLSALLVEDNRLVGEITASRLGKLFGQVWWVETGTEGLEAFSRQRPDMVFVDQLLPGMTGSEMVAEIRKLDRRVPVVGITASTMGAECEELEAAGANIAVEKPLSFIQIQAIARDLLGEAVPA